MYGDDLDQVAEFNKKMKHVLVKSRGSVYISRLSENVG